MEEGEIGDQRELFSISDEPEKISSFSTILYNKGISVVESEDTNDIPSKPKSNRVCFNCGQEDHSLRECPKPLNRIKIAKNRMQFATTRPSKSVEFTRYHQEIDDRFSDFRPGILSDKLREALGLKKDTLPRHIYNMRRLGYPPGWLEEAKISHSGINMLDSNGERVPDPDEEEGEICTVKVKYDPDKLINYPGFNVWPDPGTINETETYGSLPMCYDQSKEAFIEKLNDSNFNLENTVELGIATEMADESGEEMEIVEIGDSIRFDDDKNAKFGFVPPLPDEKIPTPPPPPPEELPDSPPLDDEDGEVNEDDVNTIIVDKDKEVSSEEEEGELPSRNSAKSYRHKNFKRLLSTTCDSEQNPLLTNRKKLKNNDKKGEEDSPPSSNSNPTSVQLLNNPENNTLTDERSEQEDLKTVVQSTEESSVIIISDNSDYESASPETSKIAQDTFGRVKSVELGTPVLNHSSYAALPSPEKFRKDISDVIYFENLPNSTGKYERLKGVLKSVRSKLCMIRGDVKK